MATAKIATLAIRTLAKPIATQLKNQAAQHETFRNICIALAQRMHRTEMALRANLLPNGIQQKVRPLNDAKAIANGANAISEGFLFFVAAALILGETYRGSRKKANQRDRTEDALNQLTDQVEKLASLLGVSLEQLDRISVQDAEAGSIGSGAPGSDITEETDPSLVEARLSIIHTKQQEEIENRRLQAAVQILLRMALKNQWVAGSEAMELNTILAGRGPKSADPSSAASASAATSSRDSSTSDSSTLSSPSLADGPPLTQPQLSVIQQVALERARALAKEVRSESPISISPDSNNSDFSLAELLENYKQRA
ncbi:OPA3-domain-containing protein [Testicularia cyperi]|uniref:OPA3-domain-containing protein n=1 Tax=Testicularia cyperi TaxID=1882483 RepID=A0A317XW18_9BASI|nr:OPA3-domain-containing protein [Testicularia cyperi]